MGSPPPPPNKHSPFLQIREVFGVSCSHRRAQGTPWLRPPQTCDRSGPRGTSKRPPPPKFPLPRGGGTPDPTNLSPRWPRCSGGRCSRCVWGARGWCCHRRAGLGRGQRAGDTPGTPGDTPRMPWGCGGRHLGLGEMPKTGSLGVVGTLGADPWGPSGGFWGHPVLSGTPRSPQDGVPGLTVLVDEHADGDAAQVEAVQEVLDVLVGHGVVPVRLLVLDDPLRHGGDDVVVPVPDRHQRVREPAQGTATALGTPGPGTAAIQAGIPRELAAGKTRSRVRWHRRVGALRGDAG